MADCDNEWSAVVHVPVRERSADWLSSALMRRMSELRSDCSEFLYLREIVGGLLLIRATKGRETPNVNGRLMGSGEA